ncbi:MAG: RAQPRD family integrative conjugative element protein [Methylococcales bacterium]
MRTIVFLSILLSVSNSVYADPEGEREALARLIHELEALAPFVADAEGQADRDSNIRFEYAWLRDDLLRMKLGIREHMTATRNQPRSITPLKGDYRAH